MNLRDLTAELSRDEGVRLKPYTDTTGHVSIGVGRNLTDVGISREEADHLLANDIARTAADLDRSLPWWESLDEVRQRVIVNMAFNLGVAGLLKWPNWLAAVHDGRYSAAADSMLQTLWARQVGPRATRLSLMMRTGTTPDAKENA